MSSADRVVLIAAITLVLSLAMSMTINSFLKYEKEIALAKIKAEVQIALTCGKEGDL